MPLSPLRSNCLALYTWFSMNTQTCTIHDITALRSATPAPLDTLPRDLPDAWTRRNEGGGELERVRRGRPSHPWRAYRLDSARADHSRVRRGAAVRAVRSSRAVPR